MLFGYCKICGEYDFTDQHRCPPAWRVMLCEDDEAVRIVHANEAKRAAEKYVEVNYANLDYPPHVAIYVRGVGHSLEQKRFEVSVEMVPEFTAVESNEVDRVLAE